MAAESFKCSFCLDTVGAMRAVWSGRYNKVTNNEITFFLKSLCDPFRGQIPDQSAGCEMKFLGLRPLAEEQTANMSGIAFLAVIILMQLGGFAAVHTENIFLMRIYVYLCYGALLFNLATSGWVFFGLFDFKDANTFYNFTTAKELGAEDLKEWHFKENCL
ncbi:unnamed protein product, partial [Mesorhabditis belari]|uniref:Uncharacterized protein n=1 Tax=Mesorhabditis belari TaxID=2138241 RepID=A0AAF3ENM5_9BILA